MPSMNTDEDLDRWKQVRDAAAACGGAFKGEINKYKKYGEYSFEAEWNPDFVKSDIFKTLSSIDVLSLVEGNPWFFGGRVRQRTETTVSGVVYTD